MTDLRSTVFRRGEYNTPNGKSPDGPPTPSLKDNQMQPYVRHDPLRSGIFGQEAFPKVESRTYLSYLSLAGEDFFEVRLHLRCWEQRLRGTKCKSDPVMSTNTGIVELQGALGGSARVAPQCHA